MNNFLRLARSQGKLPARIDSPLEAMFDQQLRAEHAPPWQRNHIFLDDRNLEIDFAWPEWRFGVEIDGAVHRIESVFHRDHEKHALALLQNWTILPATGLHVRDGRAIGWAMQLLRRFQ